MYFTGETGYSAAADNDSDGYTNQDEIDNKLLSQSDEDVICNGGNQPNDFDKEAGGPLVSDLNDDDDDADGILDQNDPFQLGDPLDSGSDAFNLPVLNELLSDNPTLKGYLGLGFTGLMNNGDANPNYLDWLDKPGPNQNDILGGAVGAMTMQMTAGTALGNTNSQEKAFQYGVNVDQNANAFTVSGRLFNFASQLQLYGSAAPTNGELGLFIGDGTQSNYIKFVITPSGLQALQEINDNPQTPVTFNIPTGNRPTNDIVMFFNVNAVTGVVTLQYTLDGGSVQTLGTITDQGVILNAIQNSNTPLAVGLIGTSNDGSKELEGTWDFLNVESTQPTIQQALPDVAELINAANQNIDLDDFFDDDNGDGNLTYTVESNTATGVGANISGNTLTLSFPATPDNGAITVRATDNSTLFIEQTFSVTVSDEPVPIIRIQANGTGITATDAPNPDWVGVSGTGAQSGTFNGISYAVGASQTSTQNVLGRDATLPAYVPQSLFTTERYGAMAWTFDLPNDDYFVRIYMGNGFNGTSTVGTRVFDITIEGQLVKNDLDMITEFGDDEGGMLEFQVTLTDGTLNIDFGPEVENPLVNGFEILSVGSVSNPPITVNAIPDQSSLEGDVANITILASGGDTNENFSFSGSNLPPGIQVEPTTGLIFGPISAGANTGSPYTSSITVDKPSSSSVTVNFNWTVTTPGGEV